MLQILQPLRRLSCPQLPASALVSKPKPRGSQMMTKLHRTRSLLSQPHSPPLPTRILLPTLVPLHVAANCKTNTHPNYKTSHKRVIYLSNASVFRLHIAASAYTHIYHQGYNCRSKNQDVYSVCRRMLKAQWFISYCRATYHITRARSRWTLQW